MTSKKTNCGEMESVLDRAKRGDKSAIQIITDKFLGLIINNYNNLVHEKIDIELEDYIQECNVKIIECINKTNKENYWQLTSMIEKSLRHKTSDVGEKISNFNKLNMLCENSIDDYRAKEIDKVHKFEDLVLGDMAVERICNTIINDKLSREEKRVFNLYISGLDLEEYAQGKGIMVKSVMKTLRSVICKIRSIEQLKNYHNMIFITLVFLKNMNTFVEIKELCCFIEIIGM